MKSLTKKSRLILCGLILAAFFLPSYKSISGFSFIPLALSEPKINSEVTLTDVTIVIIPLLAIPLSAAVLFLVSWLRFQVRKIYLALPLFCLFAFLCILLLSAHNGSSNFSSVSVLLEMGLGFYLTLIAAATLPFTRNPRKKRIRKKKEATAVEVAA